MAVPYSAVFLLCPDALIPGTGANALIDYKVRVLSPTRTNIPDAAEENGTGSNVRVLIESSDGVASWTTVGVSYSIIEASLEVLADAVTCKLYKTEQARWRAEC